jgi:hypothetical protein
MYVAAAALSTSACSTPLTDIVATSTERTGEYQVAQARRADGRMSLDVCTAPGANIDGIAERIVQQLLNQGYTDVTLELGPPASEVRSSVTRVTWTRDQGRRVESVEPGNRQRCRDWEPHGGSS